MNLIIFQSLFQSSRSPYRSAILRRVLQSKEIPKICLLYQVNLRSHLLKGDATVFRDENRNQSQRYE